MEDAQGRDAVQLTKLESPNSGSPRWSPDSSWIAFDSRSNGNADVFVVRPDGGKPRRITVNSAEDVVPSWSRDGKWIYFMSTRCGEQQIWKVPAETGESPSTPAVQVTQGGGMNAVESADGEYLYYAKGRATKGLWRKDLTHRTAARSQSWNRYRIGVGGRSAPQGVYFLEQPETPCHSKVRLSFWIRQPSGSAS